MLESRKQKGNNDHYTETNTQTFTSHNLSISQWLKTVSRKHIKSDGCRRRRRRRRRRWQQRRQRRRWRLLTNLWQKRKIISASANPFFIHPKSFSALWKREASKFNPWGFLVHYPSLMRGFLPEYPSPLWGFFTRYSFLLPAIVAWLPKVVTSFEREG